MINIFFLFLFLFLVEIIVENIFVLIHYFHVINVTDNIIIILIIDHMELQQCKIIRFFRFYFIIDFFII